MWPSWAGFWVIITELSRGAKREVVVKVCGCWGPLQCANLMYYGFLELSKSQKIDITKARLLVSELPVGLSDFLYWELNIELVLGDQVAKYQKLRKQLSWGMGYLFLLLEEEGLINTCCLSWLFKRAGFLSGNRSLRQADFTGKPIPNILSHCKLAGRGLRNYSLKLKCSVRCLTPASCAVPRGWCKLECPCCSQCVFLLPSVAEKNWKEIFSFNNSSRS